MEHLRRLLRIFSSDMRNNQRGGAIAAILISVAVVGALAVAALIATALFVAKNVRVEKNVTGKSENVRVETPFGSVRVQKRARLDPHQIGVPIYPGAEEISDDQKSASVELDFGDEYKRFTILAAEYRTPDSAAKVRDYYKKQLPHWMFVEKHHGNFEIETTEGGYKRIIAIREHLGETRIKLASIGEPAGN